MATPASIKAQAIVFQSLTNVYDLGKLCKAHPTELARMALQPKYNVFQIPKKNGTFRTIEDPQQSLKKVLQVINTHLQAVYHGKRPTVVFGFCICTSTEEDINIIANAKRHLGKKYVLNVDMKDFFHAVKQESVYQIFAQHFPKHNEELTRLLSMLCCFHGRLPMGSPTSPALSNFACLDFDAELMGYFAGVSIDLLPQQKATYTRFADDMTFSSNEPISKADEQFIRDVIAFYGFEVNEKKVVYFGEKDEKSVTGIMIGKEELYLPESYLSQLATEIERYRQVMIAESRYQTGMSHKKLALFKQELQGKWNFAQMVMGGADEIVQLKLALDEAMNPIEAYESENWLDLPYNFF